MPLTPPAIEKIFQAEFANVNNVSLQPNEDFFVEAITGEQMLNYEHVIGEVLTVVNRNNRPRYFRIQLPVWYAAHVNRQTGLPGLPEFEDEVKARAQAVVQRINELTAGAALLRACVVFRWSEHYPNARHWCLARVVVDWPQAAAH